MRVRILVASSCVNATYMLWTASAACWINPGQLSIPAPVQALVHDCLRCCYNSMLNLLFL